MTIENVGGTSDGPGSVTIGVMTLHPPAPWTLIAVEDMSSGGQTARWNTPGSSKLFLHLWPHLPPYPGQPIVIEEETEITVAGETVKLVRTSMFNGMPQEVLAVYLRRGPTIYRLVAERASRAEFEAVLQTVRWEG